MFVRSFCARRSQKHKKTDNLTVFFMLLGSACVNAARRRLMKFTPGNLKKDLTNEINDAVCSFFSLDFRYQVIAL